MSEIILVLLCSEKYIGDIYELMSLCVITDSCDNVWIYQMCHFGFGWFQQKVVCISQIW